MRPVPTGSPTAIMTRGNGRCRLLESDRGGRAGGNDQVNVQGNQLGDKGGKALILSLGPSPLNDDVFTLDIAKVTQPFAKRPDEIFLKRRGGVPQKTYPRDFLWLLRRHGRAKR